MLILLDQDGVLADFDRGFLEEWRRQFPDEPWVPLAERKSFYVRDDYPSELREKVESIYNAKSFILNLPHIEGAIEAVNDLLALGHEIRVCTSPLSRYEVVLKKNMLGSQDVLVGNLRRMLFFLKTRHLLRVMF